MASGSPSESTSAPAPMAATSPTISCPSTTGRRQWELPSPRQKWTSVPQIVEASTRTVSAPGSGLPTASSRISKGCPNAVRTAARAVLGRLLMGLLHQPTGWLT